MNTQDDELDRLFRAANPMPDAVHTPLRASDIAIRERIIRGELTPRRSRRRASAWAGLSTAVAATIALVVVAVSVLAPTQTAVAFTPPPLTYGNAEPLGDVVAEAHTRLDDTVGPEQTSAVHSLMWGWDINITKEQIEVVPQDVTFHWSVEDGSTTTIVAGESYWGDDERPQGIRASPYAPGEIISEVVTPAAEFDAPTQVIALAGSTEADLLEALNSFGTDPTVSSGAMLVAIGRLLSYWTLTDEQHATLIDLLIDAGGVTVLGRTVDRAGRDVIGLRVTDPTSPYVDTLLISIATGRIVGMENELTEPLDFIPAGVVGYTLWDDK
ncbi:hypothetical protein JOF42_000370 [Microbacterium phyllosphaerae]|uniref:Uncharacterized protein n=1 Tax=Microbacterium phyllosphaerae TaxID=124798 RepID=A0ABS4WKZ7_9MICO|nr:hypothetical protein [Microbacterium phyllosphaerae]MBP2376875.1 hypothetical protein [Microbacterium phyllosphaerae]